MPLDYGRMWAGFYQSFVKTALTFHNDLRMWSAAVESSRKDAMSESGEMQQGLESVKNLRILATCCSCQHRTKRGLNTYSVRLQTMRGFQSTHDTHGNGLEVPNTTWKYFLSSITRTMKLEDIEDPWEFIFLGTDSCFLLLGKKLGIKT